MKLRARLSCGLLNYITLHYIKLTPSEPTGLMGQCVVVLLKSSAIFMTHGSGGRRHPLTARPAERRRSPFCMSSPPAWWAGCSSSSLFHVTTGGEDLATWRGGGWGGGTGGLPESPLNCLLGLVFASSVCMNRLMHLCRSHLGLPPNWLYLWIATTHAPSSLKPPFTPLCAGWYSLN